LSGRVSAFGLLSDEEGKFDFDGVVAGLKCKVVLLTRVQPQAPPTVVVHASEAITCKPDETRDLGDLKLEPAEKK
jgi:hypothetical protein